MCECWIFVGRDGWRYCLRPTPTLPQVGNNIDIYYVINNVMYYVGNNVICYVINNVIYYIGNNVIYYVGNNIIYIMLLI